MGSPHGHAVEFAETRIRELVISGDLQPGQRVRQDHLANELGMTRVPVREAFKTLVAEGLMRHERNRGHFVAAVDPQELEQIYWLRDKLEDELVRTMVCPDVDGVARAELLNQAMGEFADAGDLVALAMANREFHFHIFEHAPKRYLIAELRKLWDRTVQYRAIYLRQPQTVNRVMSEHQPIIEAFAAGDRVSLAKLLRYQRKSGMRSVLAVLVEEREAPGPPR